MRGRDVEMHGLIASMLAAMGGVFDAQVVGRRSASGQRGVKDVIRLIDPRELGNKPPSRRDRHRAAVAAAKPKAPGPKALKTSHRPRAGWGG